MILNNQNAWLYLPKEKIAYTQNAAKILQSQVLIKFFPVRVISKKILS